MLRTILPGARSVARLRIPPSQLTFNATRHPLGVYAIRSMSSAPGEEKKAESAEEEKKASSSEEQSAPPPPPPLYERFMADMSTLLENIKATVSAGSQGTPSSAQGSSGDSDGPSNPEAGSAVVVRPPTFWEKHFQQESPFFERLRGVMGGAGDAAGRVGDFFGETEQAEALGMLKEQMPEFRQEAFLQHIGESLGPEVIGAYLKDDLDVLRANCRDQAFAILSSAVVERQTRQLRMDPRILHMSEPELESVRIINGQPTPIVSFETHQLYCIRSMATNVRTVPHSPVFFSGLE